MEFECKTVNVETQIRDTYKYFAFNEASVMKVKRTLAKIKAAARAAEALEAGEVLDGEYGFEGEDADDEGREQMEQNPENNQLSHLHSEQIRKSKRVQTPLTPQKLKEETTPREVPNDAFGIPNQKLRRSQTSHKSNRQHSRIMAQQGKLPNRLISKSTEMNKEHIYNTIEKQEQEADLDNLKKLVQQQHNMIIKVYNQLHSLQRPNQGGYNQDPISLDSIQLNLGFNNYDYQAGRPGLNDIGLNEDCQAEVTLRKKVKSKAKRDMPTRSSIINSSYFDNLDYDQPIIQPIRVEGSKSRVTVNDHLAAALKQQSDMQKLLMAREESKHILNSPQGLAQNESLCHTQGEFGATEKQQEGDPDREPQEEGKNIIGISARIQKKIMNATEGLVIENNIVRQDTSIKNQAQELKVQGTIKEYKTFKKDGVPPALMTNLIVAESLHDEVDPQYVGQGDNSDEDDGDDDDAFDITKFLIIHHENRFLGYFSVLDITCCLISSYAYAWIAYFGNDSESGGPFKITLISEIIFTISIMLKFVTTFVEEGETMPETNHGLIYQNYKENGGMQSDIVAWLPIVFFLDCSKAKFFRILYLIKTIRIFRALDKFDIVVIMGYIKVCTKAKTLKDIAKNPILGDDTLSDHNKIEALLQTGYMLRILKLVVILLNLSYFLGMIFMIIADSCKQVAYELGDIDQEFFIEYNDLESFEPAHTTIIVVYFAFTSLSTVGFGDFNPRSDFERIFTSFMLVAGVAIFSYIMGVFIEILQQYEAVTAELDDYETLSKFFGMFKHFNKGKPIHDELKKQIEQFFTYKWANDQNQAIDDASEKAILDQLPVILQDKLFFGFLFSSFLYKFATFFLLENSESGSGRAGVDLNVFRVAGVKFKRYYDMQDPSFRNFMIEVVQNLEPQQFAKGTEMVTEMDEVNEVTFVYEGNVGVGYELNKLKKIVIQFNNKCVIGAYYATFNQRANFIYCTTSHTQCYFIRRQQWLDILEGNSAIKQDMKDRIEQHYVFAIKSRLSTRKALDINKFMDRNDYHQIQLARDKMDIATNAEKKFLEQYEDQGDLDEDQIFKQMGADLEAASNQITRTLAHITNLLRAVEQRTAILNKQNQIVLSQNDTINKLRVEAQK